MTSHQLRNLPSAVTQTGVNHLGLQVDSDDELELLRAQAETRKSGHSLGKQRQLLLCAWK